MFPLESVRIENFRGVRDLDLPLHPRATVIFGRDDIGRTTLADALCTGLGAIGARMPRSGGRSFRRFDLPPGASLSSVTVRAADGLAWQVAQKRDRTVSVPPGYLGRRALHAWLDPRITAIQEDFEDRSTLLPVVAGYSRDRAVSELPALVLDQDFPRLASLELSLRSPPRFDGVFAWFLAQEDAERRARIERADWEYQLPALEWFRRALAIASPACTNPRTQIRPLRIEVDHRGDDGVVTTRELSEIPADLLAHFVLVADIARRCVQLNPSDDLDSPLQGTRSAGVVVIDELALHAPPGGPATVLPAMAAAFPNLQLIVTTGAEAVIRALDEAQVYRLDDRSGDIQVTPP